MSFELFIGKMIVYVGGTLLSLCLIGILTYWFIDLWLKKILNWKDTENRKLLFYFVRNHEKIKKEIEKKEKRRVI